MVKCHVFTASVKLLRCYNIYVMKEKSKILDLLIGCKNAGQFYPQNLSDTHLYNLFL